MKKITCCKECVPPKRYPGCKDHCEEYLIQRKARDEEADLIWKRRQEDRQFYSYNVEKKAKLLHAESRKPKVRR